ncbi:PREDICTED: uncharacterized protein LOC104613074 [Nelumbo nucifera]|uniref:Uncharacterized protein LOC104613074 n=1 Tax=Nelumbo nucifera TaxID=4432 RepID=A0A1U8BG12_NELNU|nr:PREDICTED: uncharacterized protein LOC104613074 [Nelumbo nucifera]
MSGNMLDFSAMGLLPDMKKKKRKRKASRGDASWALVAEPKVSTTIEEVPVIKLVEEDPKKEPEPSHEPEVVWSPEVHPQHPRGSFEEEVPKERQSIMDIQTCLHKSKEAVFPEEVSNMTEMYLAEIDAKINSIAHTFMKQSKDNLVRALEAEAVAKGYKSRVERAADLVDKLKEEMMSRRRRVEELRRHVEELRRHVEELELDKTKLRKDLEEKEASFADPEALLIDTLKKTKTHAIKEYKVSPFFLQERQDLGTTVFRKGFNLCRMLVRVDEDPDSEEEGDDEIDEEAVEADLDAASKDSMEEDATKDHATTTTRNRDGEPQDI